MIDAITLENFKCFERQRITLGALTLLTGVNGMGKSSVLQALLVLRQSVLSSLVPDVGVLLDGEYVRMGTAADALYDGARGDDADSIRITVSLANEEVFFRLNATDKAANVLPISETSFSHTGKWALFGRFRAAAAAEAPAKQQCFQYLSAERLGPRDSHALSRHHVKHLRELGWDGAYTVAFLDAHGGEHVEAKMRHDDAASAQLLSQVTAWLGEVSPGVRLATLEYQELGRAGLSLSFVSGQATSRRMRPSGVGFGLSYTLPVIVALLASKAGDLVLLENPEAHLHPRGQMAVGSLMARAAAAGVQVVCETHSDHLLNGVRLAVKEGILEPERLHLHYFSRTHDGERIVHRIDSPRINGDGRIDRWPPGFFDQWDIALERLL
jgi:predicted ATPase